MFGICILKQLFTLIVCQIFVQCLLYAEEQDNRWPDHDISTLKLLQVVHRHGDRNPVLFAPSDPYQSTKYWKEGIGELTVQGKYRMFKLGQYLRNEYHSYLGDNYSPREVYARSSLSNRCIESLSSLLAGAYPPKHSDWMWNNGTDASLGQHWQPIPIETYMPKKDDLVLRQDKYCPIVDIEREIIYRSDAVQNYLKNRTELFDKLSSVVGYPVDSIKKSNLIHTAFEIEMSKGLYWSHVWPKEEQQLIVDQLRDVHRFAYRINWNSTVIKRLRAGGLVKELVKNFESVSKEQNKKKLYIYSTHDSMLAALMHAFNVFDGEIPQFGSTLLLELHQNSTTEEYFVRIFYIRDIFNGNVTALSLVDCGSKYDCPIEDWIESTKPYIYNRFKKECKNFIDNKKYIENDNLYFIG